MVALGRPLGGTDRITSADGLPAVSGPYAELSEPHQVPRGVADAPLWVERVMACASRPPPRDAATGSRFFETHQVAHRLKSTFVPKDDAGCFFRQRAAGLERISRWVDGQGAQMLMEPVHPLRERLERDLQQVSARSLGYRWALDRFEGTRSGEPVASLTAGGGRAPRHEALAPSAHRVVDPEAARVRAAFLGSTRALAATSRVQLERELPA